MGVLPCPNRRRREEECACFELYNNLKWAFLAGAGAQHVTQIKKRKSSFPNI
jgi:hypothetical protein